MRRHTRKVERTVLADGTRVPLLHNATAGTSAAAAQVVAPADRGSRSALTVAEASGQGVQGITGAAIAATTADVMTPYLEARVRFDTFQENPYEGSLTSAPYPSPASWEDAPDTGSGGFTTPGSRTARDYPDVHLFQLDVDTLDTTATPYDWHDNLPTVSYWPEEPLRRLVRNAEAAGGVDPEDEWSAAGGAAYSTAEEPTAPEDPLDPGAARRVHVFDASAGTGAAIASPWSVCSYAFASGRPFVVVAWIRAVSGFAWVRADMVWRDEFDPEHETVMEGTTALVQSEWTRCVFVVREAPDPSEASARRHERRVVFTVSSGAGVLQVRLPHAYAGVDDRGDRAGLLAVPVPNPIGRRVAVVTGGRSRVVNRVDVTGDGAHGRVTAFSGFAWDEADPMDAFVPFYYGGPGDGAARLRRPVVLHPSSDDTGPAWTDGGSLAVTVEEVDTGPGGFVWVHKIEPSYEVDLTPDLLRLTVDRTADADPTDSTTPLGNFAATALELDLDNTGGKWSPFRVDYLTVAHEVEAAAGVVYTNRHPDPQGRAEVAELATGWYGGSLVDAPELGGVRPMSGRALEVTADVGLAVILPPPGEQGARYRVRALVACDTPGAVAATYGSTAYAEVPLVPGQWVPVTFTIDTADDVAAGYPVGVSALSEAGTVWIADPEVVRLDPAHGDAVVEVVEATPVGVFYVTAWPAATGSPTVQVSAVDALALYGDAEPAQELRRNVYLSDVLSGLALEAFDIPPFAQVIPPSSGPMPWVLPPTTQLSTFLADLAKAEARSLYVDGLGRLVAQNRQYVETDTSGEYREDTAAVELTTPLSLDMVRNRARVVGKVVRADTSRATIGVIGEEGSPNLSTWSATSSEFLRMQPGQSASFTVFVDDMAAVADVQVAAAFAFLKAQVDNTSNRPLTNTIAPLEPETGNVPPGAAVGYEVTAYPTFVSVLFKASSEAYMPHFRLTGLPIRETDVVQTVTRPTSVHQFGDRPVDVEVRVVTDPAFLAAVGEDVLDTWALVGDDGEKWLPDLEVEALGDPWRELGDRVVAAEPTSGIGGEYRVVSHTYDVGVGATSSLYLRQVPGGLRFMVLDVDTLDGPAVLGY